MVTPNLDKYARAGVILNSSYVQYFCSPSRNAFMTGYFPYHTGLQHQVILDGTPRYLPLSFTTLPQHLKKAGYATHIVGKWHLGMCDWKLTPTYRGFDSFFGYYSGMEDYYTHMEHFKTDEGYDLRNDTEVFRDPKETHFNYLFTKHAIDVIEQHDPSTPLYLYLPFHLVHAPLQVPMRFENMYKNIQNGSRRTFCGMVSMMDESFGNITKALERAGLLDNALLVFTTDNGGPVNGGANNWPLRGGKTTFWEGGTRGSAFVYSTSLLKKTGYVNNGYVNLSVGKSARMREAVDPMLRDQQAGFRRNRSCADQIASLRIIVEQSLEWNSPLYINFIDYEKAFDSVDREALWKLLRHYGVPGKIISLIQCTYKDMSCRIAHAGQLSESFEVKTGVRQGCLLSPFLFLLVIDWIMKTTTTGRKNGIQWTLWTQLDDLDFADDLALLSHSHSQMQDKTTCLEATSAGTGLKINRRKTELMKINTTANTPVTVGGESIREVESFVYLGSVVDGQGGTDRDVTARIGKARAAMVMLKNIWASKVVSIRTKLRIFNSNVKSVLLYGCETWRTTKTMQQKIQTFLNTCLRRIFNIRWPEKIRNEELWERAGQEPAAKQILRRNKREEFVYNIDTILNSTAIRYKDYKLMTGSPGSFNDWYPVPKLGNGDWQLGNGDWQLGNGDSDAASDQQLQPKWPPRLYNIKEDPEERDNLAEAQPDMMRFMLTRLDQWMKSGVPPQNQPLDPRGDPKNWGGVWTPGWCTPK
nr:hypothetical protein BaRGS_001855 [Batillaria attramentaria]